MSKKTDWHKEKRTTFLQILVALLLFTLPVIMIGVNGKRAIEGILWGKVSFSAGDKPTNAAPDILFGIYDPEGAFDTVQELSLEQVYFSWTHFDDEELTMSLKKIHDKGRTPVLTIEPWEKDGRKATLLEDIVDGQYDDIISRIATVINTFGRAVYISWGHEMDQDLTERYSWSAADPELFVRAYRHYYDETVRSVSTPITWIWAPVVKPGTERYWPGDTFVDVVGIPVYGYPDWELSFFGQVKSFDDWYFDKLSLIKRYQKPVIITEMGVTGSYSYREQWLSQAFRTIRQSPDIKAVIFFHAGDTPGVWGDNIPTPDWRIDPKMAVELMRGTGSR